MEVSPLQAEASMGGEREHWEERTVRVKKEPFEEDEVGWEWRKSRKELKNAGNIRIKKEVTEGESCIRTIPII